MGVSDFRDLVVGNVGVTCIICIILFILLWNIFIWIIDSWNEYHFTLNGKHVLITGGSLGLGRSLAVEYSKLGAKVTILARNQQTLDEAKGFILSQTNSNNKNKNNNNDEKQLQQSLSKQNVSVIAVSADVTNPQQVTDAINNAVQRQEQEIDVLVLCAGSASTGYFLQKKEDDFKNSMNLNYFGALWPIRAVVPSMMEKRDGHIIIVSSGMAMTGYIGYSAYAPTKYALKGLGDTLRNELCPFNIKIYQAYPPNFHSPGYENENKTKPLETKAIESSETTYQSEAVAKNMISSFRKGHYHIACGDLGINLLSRSTAGMSPRNNSFADALLLPLLVLIGKIYVSGWDNEVKKEKYKQLPERKSSSSQQRQKSKGKK